MKRRISRLALFLLLGAIINVAVAWGFAVWQTVPMYPRTAQSAFVLQNRPWHLAQLRVFGVRDLWWLDLQADYPGQSAEKTVAQVIAQYELHTPAPQRIRHTVDPPGWGTLAAKILPPPEFVIGSDSAFGWPLPCMWYQVRGKVVGNSTAAEELHG